MRPFSTDLRQRIVHAVLIDGLSSREVAERFQVSQRTVNRYCQQYRETGDLRSRRPTGRPPIFTPADTRALLDQFQQRPTATLRELQHWFHERSGRWTSLTTIWRRIIQAGWTRKKERWCPPNGTRSTGPHGVRP
jgi:transposase